MGESAIILGNYELLEVIGDGKEGRVYKACCIAEGVSGVSRGEMLALKRLKNTGHEKESQQFQRQIEILRKLNHPNIVRYRDSFVWRENELEEDIYCLVMELLDGETLKSLLEKNRNGLPWGEASAIFSQILQALQYAGKNGVVHRDLKPSNIYVTRQGIPKLVDFGIARQDDGEATATSTAVGAKGTFDYMAPDFALVHDGGFRGDEQSDIFSFGVLLYYALTGRLPFPPLGENAVQKYYTRWLGQQLPNVEFRHPIFRVLSHARTCVAKCIDPGRQVRFRSFDEVMADFARIGYRKLKHGTEAYEFVDWLGKGGFGEVFRARRVSDKREVAVKRLFSTGQSARFVREANILRNAKHPNLVDYVDFVEIRQRADEREYYLILEYLEGMPGASLRERIKSSESGLDAIEAMHLFMGYLDCLEHLHDNGIIHRDIKPGNLYAPEHNPQKAKIFDLGIAHDEEGTRTHGQVPGTLDFMPPEFATQASGRGSPQSDIYSIGVTLYQALTKKLPFPRLPEKESEGWVAFIKRSEIPLECAFDHPVFEKHPELVPLLRRALANDPKRRHESAKAMLGEIGGILEGWEKKKAYDTALAAGRTALGQQDYNEAERQAERAMELLPRDQAAKQLFSQAQGGKLHKEPVADIDERPTAETIPSVESMGAEIAEDATAETRPADLKRILEFEGVAREEQKKRDQAEREQAEREKFQKDEERRQAGQASRKRKKARILWMAKAVAVLALAVGLYCGWRVWELSRVKQHEQNYRAAMAVGQQAYVVKDCATASEQADVALANKPGDAAAMKLKSDAQAEMAAQAELDRKYNEALAAGRKAYDLKDYATASQQADVALANKPRDDAARKLKNDTQAEMASQAERDRKYNEALAAGWKAYDLKDHTTASEQADVALANKPGDAAAMKLKSDAQAEIAARAARDSKYNEAMVAGRKAYALNDYATASQQADAALANKPGDAAAMKLKSDAQAEIAAQAARDRKYNEAVAAGRKAYALNDYATASQQADAALANKPGDAAAMKLKSDAQAEMAAQAERDRKYNEALAAGRKAYDLKDYATANQQADVALANRPGDAAAMKLKSDAQAEMAAQAEQDRKCNEALAAGRKAYDLKDYATAIKQAEVALAIKSGDAAAATLKHEAQACQLPLLFGVSDFDFVWIPSLQNGKGACIEKTVLSQTQYSSLAQKYGLKSPGMQGFTMQIQGTTLDDPIKLTWDDTVRLRDALNSAARQAKLQGQFQLPSRQDFLIFSEIKDSTADTNPTYDTLARLNLFSRLHANVNGVPARGVGAGNANQFGLFNVLGYAWEWCDDTSGAGFDINSKSDSPKNLGNLFSENKWVKGEYTGVRFLFVPDR